MQEVGKGVAMPRVNLEDLFVYDQWAVYARQLDRLESHLEQDLQSFEQWVEQQAKRIDDEDTLSQFYDFYSEEYHEHKEFKVILMNSLFVSSFASFEHQLMQICHVAEGNSGSPFSERDLRSSSSTERAKTYLTKLGIEFPSDSQEWQNITRYREIRNKIMHNGGGFDVEEDEGDLARFARQKRIFTASRSELTGGSLELTRAFCDEAGEQMNQLLRAVYRTYRRWRKTHE